VQFDVSKTFRWPEYSQGKSSCITLFFLDFLLPLLEKLAWGAVSLGSIDLALVAVAISPIGLSKTSG